MTIHQPPDLITRIEAAHQAHIDLSARIADTHVVLAAIPAPAAGGAWADYWAALAATETALADLYQQRADRDPADTEATAITLHYRNRAAVSTQYAQRDTAVTA